VCRKCSNFFTQRRAVPVRHLSAGDPTHVWWKSFSQIVVGTLFALDVVLIESRFFNAVMSNSRITGREGFLVNAASVLRSSVPFAFAKASVPHLIRVRSGINACRVILWKNEVYFVHNSQCTMLPSRSTIFAIFSNFQLFCHLLFPSQTQH